MVRFDRSSDRGWLGLTEGVNVKLNTRISFIPYFPHSQHGACVASKFALMSWVNLAGG